jgi:tetratricopeptide (TPR) repeat protein
VALAHYIEAYEHFSRLPNRQREMARCERKMATVYLHQGDWVRARDMLDSAYSLCEELHAKNPQAGEYELARTAYVRGWAHNLAGAWEDARQSHMTGFEKAEQFTTKREKSDKYLIMLGHSYLATDERQLDNFTSAEYHYRQAEAICTKQGYTREKAWIYLGLARLYANQKSRNGENWGDKQKAEHYFDCAQKEAHQMGSKYQLTMILSHAANLALSENSEAGIQKALDHLIQADRLARELGAAYYIAGIQRQMAEIYLRRGDFDHIALAVRELEELHRRYHYHNHMAWIRTIEAKAILQQHTTASAEHDAWNDVAKFYADALMHGLRFNTFWAQQILQDFAHTIVALAEPVQARLRREVAEQLGEHKEIRPYEQNVIQRRTDLLETLKALA